MKKEVTKFIRAYGGQSHYSGKDKIMYIDDPNGNDIEIKIIEEFGYGLPFKLQTN